MAIETNTGFSGLVQSPVDSQAIQNGSGTTSANTVNRTPEGNPVTASVPSATPIAPRPIEPYPPARSSIAKPIPSQDDFVLNITERAKLQIVSAMAGDVSRYLVIKKPFSSRSTEFELEIDVRHDPSTHYLCTTNDIKVLIPIPAAGSLHNATLDFVDKGGELMFEIKESK